MVLRPSVKEYVTERSTRTGLKRAGVGTVWLTCRGERTLSPNFKLHIRLLSWLQLLLLPKGRNGKLKRLYPARVQRHAGHPSRVGTLTRCALLAWVLSTLKHHCLTLRGARTAHRCRKRSVRGS
ncbi:hypothetical protein GOODEAATRI_005877 [Goodea atripinnis]|uniref:Uncharacterized protein n=1 Tax=Goodea atripinnis TaxID=208336 RepID=A0ABV0NS59_9TELE